MPTIPADFAAAAQHLLGTACYDAMLGAGLNVQDMCAELARRNLLSDLRCDDRHRGLADLAIIQRYARRIWRPFVTATDR